MFDADYVWISMPGSAILFGLFGYLIGQRAAYRDCARRERAALASGAPVTAPEPVGVVTKPGVGSLWNEESCRVGDNLYTESRLRDVIIDGCEIADRPLTPYAQIYSKTGVLNVGTYLHADAYMECGKCGKHSEIGHFGGPLQCPHCYSTHIERMVIGGRKPSWFDEKIKE